MRNLYKVANLMKVARTTLSFALLLLMSACQEASVENPIATRKQTLDTLDYGKPQAPVALEYVLPQSIQLGDQFTLQLVFSSYTGAGTMEVSLNAEPGLQLLGGHSARFNLSDSDKSMQVDLLAVENGKIYLNVSVAEVDESGQPLLGRSFSVPIQIGPKSAVSASRNSAAKEQKLMQDGDERIIEIPAELRP